MHGVMLEMAGMATGLLAYAVWRGVLAWRDAHRASTRSDRRARLDGLLAPYDSLTLVPIPVRDEQRELPPNVYPLRRR
jgi:hypothetical protein